MKTIIEALKRGDLQLHCHERWLEWNILSKEWRVFRKLKGFAYATQKNNNLLCSTKDEKIAVDYLLGNRG